MNYDNFSGLAQGAGRLVNIKDGFIFGKTEVRDGFVYAYYLYVDGKVVEKSKYSNQSVYKFKTKTSSNNIAVINTII